MCNFFCLITPLGCLPFALVPPRLASSENDFERRALLGGVGLGPYVQFISTWVVGVSWIVDSVDWAKSCSNWYGKYSMIYSFFCHFTWLEVGSMLQFSLSKPPRPVSHLNFFQVGSRDKKQCQLDFGFFKKILKYIGVRDLCVYIYIYLL